jgi:hypothetical protein
VYPLTRPHWPSPPPQRNNDSRPSLFPQYLPLRRQRAYSTATPPPNMFLAPPTVLFKTRQAGPGILWKPIGREKDEASGVPDMFGPCNSIVTLFVPLARRGFFSNLVCTIGSWTAGTSTEPSSNSVTIHPPPDIETKKLCVHVVRKAPPMIDISQDPLKLPSS